jgi:hypothetical protein
MTRERHFHLDERRVPLPKGTRVVLRTDLRADDGYLCKAGSLGVVVELAYDSYAVRTPAGRRVECQRDQLALQREEQLPALVARQHDFAALRERVIYAAVVGSTAWGLADASSDEDVKGVFVLPFAGFSGLWEPVDEIRDPEHDVQYWELQKLVYQGLRADANTLETLWSPLVKVETPLGAELRARRRMFVSRQVYGTFGRYAMSQFRKMRAARRRRVVERRIALELAAAPSLAEAELVRRLTAGGEAPCTSEADARDAVRDLYRSLFDRGLLAQRGYAPLAQLLRERPEEVLREDSVFPQRRLRREDPNPLRWKNAYNLLRLLASGVRWLREGEPLIVVEEPLRGELLAVKRGQVELEQVLGRADELAREMERALEGTALPEQPDYDAAQAFLLECRERAAVEHLAARGGKRGSRAARGAERPKTARGRRLAGTRRAARSHVCCAATAMSSSASSRPTSSPPSGPTRGSRSCARSLAPT